MNSVKLIKNNHSKAQRWWVFVVRLVGFLVFVIPLIQPMYSYMIIGMEEVEFSKTRTILVIVGFVTCSNGKLIGIVNNNVGMFIRQALKKLIS
ncbi:hypothetical protein C8N46_102134 [Kordia periserrulae]|uniref:Uncharacterized protein n=1 Tax=Kordia periserrulae TaxID=701523 RepID=A0A2T6C339_9FLAO|nr:hypothetical protein [Kordia periserrulae]PTX62734.1 hypothetical protein C8N46_102134 [Kordia periserrulae]